MPSKAGIQDGLPGRSVALAAGRSIVGMGSPKSRWWHDAGEALTRRLAQLRGLSRRQANDLRNRGLFVREAFGLIEI